MRKHWLVGGLAGAMAPASLAFIQAKDAQQAAPPGSAVAFVAAQPIAFPHNTHAGAEPGQMGMDCQYCHFSAGLHVQNSACIIFRLSAEW